MRGGGRGGRGGGRGGARGGARFGGARERDNSNNADHKISGAGAGSVVADASSAALDWGESNLADSSGWGESANIIAPATGGWGETAPEVSTSTEPESKIEPAAPAPTVLTNGTPSTQKPSPAPAPNPTTPPITSKSSRVPPGAKLSWAQITRCVFSGRC
jgi:hypothetical protein